MTEVHADKNQVCCCECLQLFENEDGLLRKHILKNHHSAHPLTHLCTLCGNSFYSAHALRSHIASIHDKSKAHVCPECGKSFPTKPKIDRHLKQAHSPRVMKCLHCPKTFCLGNTEKMVRHLMIHTGMKPFGCYHCNYSSERKSNVSLHVKKTHHKDWENADIVTDDKLWNDMVKIAYSEVKEIKAKCQELQLIVGKKNNDLDLLRGDVLM